MVFDGKLYAASLDHTKYAVNTTTVGTATSLADAVGTTLDMDWEHQPPPAGVNSIVYAGDDPALRDQYGIPVPAFDMPATWIP